jgi:hypothetical protein
MVLQQRFYADAMQRHPSILPEMTPTTSSMTGIGADRISGMSHGMSSEAGKMSSSLDGDLKHWLNLMRFNALVKALLGSPVRNGLRMWTKPYRCPKSPMPILSCHRCEEP